MSSTIGPDTRKYVLYPLAVIMIAISFHNLMPLLVPEAGIFNLRFPGSFVHWVLIFVGTLVACTGIFMNRIKIAFWGIVVFGCSAIADFLLVTLNVILKNADLIRWNINIPYYLLGAIVSIPSLTAIFVLLPLRKYFFSKAESTSGILPLLGTIFLVRGLFSAGAYLFMSNYFDFEPFILPAISVLIGIGILSRERFLGIFGILVWLVYSVYEILPLTRRIPTISDLPIMKKIVFIEARGNLLFYIAVFFIILIVFRRQFTRNILSGFAAYSAGIHKQCSSCGRSVPSRSSVGDRCPHCGAYWSYEKTKR